MQEQDSDCYLLQEQDSESEAADSEDEHVSLPAAGFSVAAWPVAHSPSSPAFRYFRVIQTGANTSGNHRLYCRGFDIYGFLFK